MLSTGQKNRLLVATCVAGVAAVVYIFATASFSWNEIPKYLFAPQIVAGARS